MESSSIVDTTSTNGTAAITPLYNSGFLLITAPINNPPAEPPEAYKCSFEVYFCSITNLEQSIKSVKVFFFFNSFPSSYHGLPKSSPPLMCAMAKINPLSTRLNLAVEKYGSIEAPYEP